MDLDYEVLDQRRILDAFFKLDRYHLRHTSFNGGWCDEIVRERVERLAAVSVLLYDPDADTMVFVEQFRVGLMGAVEPPWCLETVSGFCDRAHEQPEEVARREVLEETGCTVQELHHVGEFFVSPGMSVERINLYCGRIDSRKAEGVHGLAHEGEEMRVVKLPRAEATAELFGRLNSTSVIIGMQWLQQHREAIVGAWCRGKSMSSD